MSATLDSCPSSITGSRRITLTMLTARDRADSFTGLPAGTAKPFGCWPRFRRPSPISACRRTPSSWCRGW